VTLELWTCVQDLTTLQTILSVADQRRVHRPVIWCTSLTPVYCCSLRNSNSASPTTRHTSSSLQLSLTVHHAHPLHTPYTSYIWVPCSISGVRAYFIPKRLRPLNWTICLSPCNQGLTLCQDTASSKLVSPEQIRACTWS